MKAEVERRRRLGAQSQHRRELISANYEPLHPHVYTLQVGARPRVGRWPVQQGRESREGIGEMLGAVESSKRTPFL